MIAYLDSSVLLRVALNQKNSLKEFSQITLGISSRILKVECLRTLDRLHAMDRIRDDDLLALTEFIYDALARIELIPLVDAILDQASQPTGLRLGSLDAIHLFSATSWRSRQNQVITFLTHDSELGRAALLSGFSVFGL